MEWFCQSCSTLQSGDRVKHFKSNHYFRPVEVEAQVTPQEQKVQDQQDSVGFFHDEFNIEQIICPSCTNVTKMYVRQNLQSIRITCESCSQIKFYRLVIDRQPVESEKEIVQ